MIMTLAKMVMIAEILNSGYGGGGGGVQGCIEHQVLGGVEQTC